MSMLTDIIGSSRRRGGGADELLDGLVEWWWLDSANAGTGANGAFNLTENGTLTKNASGGPGDLGYTTGVADTAANHYSHADNAAFNVGNYTYSCWARIPATLLNTSTSFALFGNHTRPYLSIQTNDGTTPTEFRANARGDESINAASAYIVADPRGVWQHIVLSRAAAGNWNVYRNGSSIITRTSGTTSTSAGDLRWMRNGAFAGASPDLCLAGFWDRALTTDEISRLYGSGAPLTPTDIGL